MKNGKLILAALALCLVAGGCKTTEKNYKAAYDVAVQKRKAASSEPEIGLGEGSLQQVDGPSKRIVGDNEFYFERLKLKFVDGLEGVKHRYCVAVGAYKMKTNCSAQVSDLFTKGYKAFSAVDADGMYYVIAGSFKTLEEAADFARDFAATEKQITYIGLPSAPVVIED